MGRSWARGWGWEWPLTGFARSTSPTSLPSHPQQGLGEQAEFAARAEATLPSDREAPAATGHACAALGALVLIVVSLGLPINDLFRYALLVVSAVVIFTGVVSMRARRWIAAAAVVAVCVLAQFLWPAPRIEEGQNVFLIDRPGGALEAGLPTNAFHF